MANLEIELAGVRFPNPVIITSSSLTNRMDKLRRLEQMGAGGLITKAISKFAAPTQTKLRAVFHGQGWGIAGDARIPLAEAVEMIQQAKRELSIPIIANVIGFSDDAAIWGETSRAVEHAGADMIELDLNCHPEGGLVIDVEPNLALFDRISIGQDPAATGRVVKAVKEAVRIPVIGKLTPRASDMIGIAQACKANGADAISGINAIRGLPGVDIAHGGRPIYPGVQVQSLSPICGPELNPVALAYTAMLSKTVDLPLISGGGVMSPEHVVERLMLGARAVGICSVVYLKGLQAIADCVQGLAKFLDTYGYADCNAIRGLGQAYFARHDQVVMRPLESPNQTLGEERVGW